MPRPEILSYGAHPDQHVVLDRAATPPRGTAVLVHGGYWRQAHTLELMEPLIGPLAAAGWNVANVEYRRGPGAPWPLPLDDVRAACAVVADRHLEGPLVAVGHSVGGELALLAGAPLDAVVALAPVTDAARTHAESLGDGAAREYFGTSPAQDPARYASASPVVRVDAARPALVVHGADDSRVPVRHTLDYLVAAWDAGAPVTALLPDRLGHLEVIDPALPHWPAVLQWLAEHTAAAGQTEAPSTDRA
ncbi:alpha/beta hydrolase family protein [Arthrobacter sp. JSM 101049]|uniref:alpha/beta hydrolase family protein n=1 Tax=Arthrobacter sp. JSM 101049 TaxID=929097 RepID=UPI003563BAC6